MQKMRMSCCPKDSGYQAWSNAEGIAYVYLNGIEQPYVRTADEELGMLIKFALDERGSVFVRDGDELAEETLYGNVKIEVR